MNKKGTATGLKRLPQGGASRSRHRPLTIRGWAFDAVTTIRNRKRGPKALLS